MTSPVLHGATHGAVALALIACGAARRRAARVALAGAALALCWPLHRHHHPRTKERP